MTPHLDGSGGLLGRFLQLRLALLQLRRLLVVRLRGSRGIGASLLARSLRLLRAACCSCALSLLGRQRFLRLRRCGGSSLRT